MNRMEEFLKIVYKQFQQTEFNLGIKFRRILQKSQNTSWYSQLNGFQQRRTLSRTIPDTTKQVWHTSSVITLQTSK
ncbi:unnamed protein product [Paramecium pentaurelia]|uniref:Uncharacterized protein n=1 Tax=Paramecium pentaurelia TaxID=43138 RepID=A0A8S1UZP8_9CILI|nr:unnamed protein product [Paramecium pentaurelia]